MKIIDKSALRCPTCGLPMEPAVNIEGTSSQFWMRCTNPRCHTFVDTYIPQDHQKSVHTDSTTYLGIFGGYGSGKTQASLKDDEKHMLSTPNGMTVVGSAVLQQVESTYEKDFRNDMPQEFVLSHNSTKKRYKLINGHEVLIRSFYDEELLRSMNATRWHIVEASAVDHEVFVQLQARLRNEAATIKKLDPITHAPVINPNTKEFEYEADWRKGIIESNPSVGWIRDKFLLESGKIFSDIRYDVPSPNDRFSSYVFPTKLNKFLPAGFEKDLAKNKPLWWVNRYLNGSFDYAEGMVYPNIMKAFCNSFKVPDEWFRVMAMDYGINDQTSFVFGAIDPVNNILYIIGSTYENNRNYKEQSAIYWEAHKKYVPNNNYYKTPVMDGRSINKRNDFNMKTIGDLFREEGIRFNPAKMDMNARMLQVNTMVDAGRIKIFRDTNPDLYKELVNYKFPERTADGRSKGDKPVDKNNHAVNAMEFLCMELPVDMVIRDMYAYNGDGSIMKVPDKYATGILPKTEHKKPRNPYAFDPFVNDTQARDVGYKDMFRGGIDSW